MNHHISYALQKSVHLLQCPFCYSHVTIQDSFLICGHKHTFDIAKTGYINVLRKTPKFQYNTTLFEARRNITQRGFFSGLERAIIKTCTNETTEQNALVIVDAGCGEGTLFSNVVNALQQYYQRNLISIGFDIASNGIRIASKNGKTVLWFVADITHIPLRDSSVDIVLNTLAPANYSEFARVLKRGGLLLKTIPNKQHLQELRIAFSKQTYDNTSIIDLFEAHFTIYKQILLKETKIPKDDNVMDIVKMTPLSWNQDFLSPSFHLPNELTIDFTILVGKK